MRILVTGGAGFIGSALVRRLVSDGHEVLNFDKLTYAGDLRAVEAVAGNPNYRFVRACVTDQESLRSAFLEFGPARVVHLAAESHVDRSIDGPGDFIQSNVVGTFVLLQVALSYWSSLPRAEREAFRLVHVSTDEVYGSLGPEGRFHETTPYQPNSPYAASKASADLLARAWYKTYGLPVVISNCSNNYGPFQHAEKLIPTIIRSALKGRSIPIYGRGENIRDWLYVDDHVDGLSVLLEKGRPGEKYNIGGDSEARNIDLARLICVILDQFRPRRDGHLYGEQIAFVRDRPGHDQRYAIDASKIEAEFGWRPREMLESGLRKTIRWYLDHEDWWLGIEAARMGLSRDAEAVTLA